MERPRSRSLPRTVMHVMDCSLKCGMFPHVAPQGSRDAAQVTYLLPLTAENTRVPGPALNGLSLEIITMFCIKSTRQMLKCEHGLCDHGCLRHSTSASVLLRPMLSERTAAIQC